MEKLHKKNNINSVVSNELCLFCGMCYSVCPKNAIEFKGKFEKKPYSNDNCNYCGQCYSFCPGIYPLQCSNENSAIGEYIKCYIGYSYNPEIRLKAASGGIITSINKYVLKKFDYNGVICIRQSKNNIFENEVFLARSDKEIESATGTRYSPAFVCKAFKDIPLIKGGKYVFIGKPCDVQALLKADKINKNYTFFTIALFCARTPSAQATKEIIQNNQIDIDHIKTIRYRGNGWPGNFTIISDKNKIIFEQPYIEVWSSIFCKNKFLNKRCILCNDPTGEHADISVGDAWLPEFIGQSPGHSIVITRTKLGNNIIDTCLNNKILNIFETNSEKIYRSQESLLLRKKNYNINIVVAKLMFEKVPLNTCKIKFRFREIKKIPRICILYFYKKWLRCIN